MQVVAYKSSKKSKKAEAAAESDEEPAEEPWQDFFNDSSEDETSDVDDNGKMKVKPRKAGPAKNRSKLPLKDLVFHKRAFTSCWLSLLKPHEQHGVERGLNLEETRRVLVVVHRLVIPSLTKPVMLMDFLSDCLDRGEYLCLKS